MKPIYLAVLILTCAAIHASATPHPPRMIVRGDDMGYSQAGNAAIIACHKHGVETTAEVIVPAPWFPEAVRLLHENPDLDVGVHLTLTSEWDNMKWRPLSDATTLRDENGYFFPMIWPTPDYPGRALRERAFSLADIEREFRAQIETALRNIPRVSHISGHMGCTDFDPSVEQLSRRLATEYDLHIDLSVHSVVDIGYGGSAKTPEEKTASFLLMLEHLEPGKTYLFVDHPSYDTPEIRQLWTAGYQDVALDRQGVVDTWTSPRVNEAIRRRGIELISYADLRTIDPAAGKSD